MATMFARVRTPHASVAMLSAAGWILGCSPAGPGALGADDGAASPALDGSAGNDGVVANAFNDGDSGSTGVFQAADAAPANVMFPCQPGTYSGMFTTTVTTDAGLFPSLLSFDWTGTLSVTLVGHVTETTTQTGELPVVDPVLTIAPGAMLSGTDNFGGHFVAGLSGQLDCPSKALTGMLMNGSYDYWWSDAGGIVMTGSLTGVYQDTPASLTMGTISVGSPMYSSLEANGSWSATHE
jgi:hypothetical protein